MDKSDSALLRCDKNQNTTCDPPDKPENNNMIPSKPSKLITALSSLLPSNYLNLPPRWQNWFVRGQSGLLLISAFCTLISLGPLGLFSLTLVVQVHIDIYQEPIGDRGKYYNPGFLILRINATGPKNNKRT